MNVAMLITLTTFLGFFQNANAFELPFEKIQYPSIKGNLISANSSKNGACLALGYPNGVVAGSSKKEYYYIQTRGALLDRIRFADLATNTLKINKHGNIIKQYAREMSYIGTISCWR